MDPEYIKGTRCNNKTQSTWPFKQIDAIVSLNSHWTLFQLSTDFKLEHQRTAKPVQEVALM